MTNIQINDESIRAAVSALAAAVDAEQAGRGADRG